MTLKNLVKKKWFRIVSVFILSTIISYIITDLRLYILYRTTNVHNFLEEQTFMLMRIYLWVFVGFIIYKISILFPFNEKRWKSSLIVHIIGSFIISLFHVYLNYFGSYLLKIIYFHRFNFYGMGLTINNVIMSFYKYNLLVYWIMLGASIAFNYYRQLKKREIEAAQLESQLTRAQLNSLKMQLHPHFLFNTLHTAIGLMNKDIEAAKDILTLLSDLLRITLTFTDQQEISLKKEMEFIDKYLEIQKIRFGEKLNIKTDINQDTLNAAVPAMILQPITENAISHGISPYKRPGHLKVSSKRKNEYLILEVHDSGNPIQSYEKIEKSDGIGIKNTIDRLNKLYGKKYTFELINSSLGGLLVKISIPFKKAEEENL